MTITSFRRRWPSLVRRAERDMGKEFKKKPTLKLQRNTGRSVAYFDEDPVRIHISRRMVRDHTRLAEAVVLHELREGLLIQDGMSETRAHRLIAKRRFHERDAKRLGLKTLGWELRDYYGDKRRQRRELF